MLAVRTIGQRVSRAGITVAVSLSLAGCSGDGEPDRINGLDRYIAASQAKQVMSQEADDPSSVAYKELLLVQDTVGDRLDGRAVWRVSFKTPEGAPSNICIWIWLSAAGPLQEEYTYVIDRCPSPGTS